jgi:copper resistance protein B
VHGLAAYWFDVDASVYVGDQGRTAFRISSEYELLLSQRWLVEPRVELNAYGEEDRENGIGSGISDGEFGVRLRYEIRREFAPYVGVTWKRRFGQTANLAEAVGADRSEVGWVVGIRGWL